MWKCRHVNTILYKINKMRKSSSARHELGPKRAQLALAHGLRRAFSFGSRPKRSARSLRRWEASSTFIRKPMSSKCFRKRLWM